MIIRNGLVLAVFLTFLYSINSFGKGNYFQFNQNSIHSSRYTIYLHSNFTISSSLITTKKNHNKKVEICILFSSNQTL
ncbi:hypothetical protein BDA99DRAFT_492907 [Phascolomyces articulosus]|uniref:Secreted protein n=1 Tax=Phascolomyces articulosus TaxID=60185 RepID=A0AAD5KCM0_9FUNG|nr:hypothetical protein BDA99DRAFT_492907 [Phascolomyces articulosus]